MKALVFVLFSLIPAFSQGQSLAPGIHRNLKPTQPLVLDTGSFTFIGLEMQNLGKGIWLDARKAREVVLLQCRFSSGNMQGKGVLSSGNLKVRRCSFSNLEQALLQETAPGTRLAVEVSHNLFIDNRAAISLQRSVKMVSQYPRIPNSPNGLKPTFSGNRFTNCIYGLAIGLNPAAAANQVVVDGCTFTNNVGTGILFSGSGVKSVQNAVFQLPFTPNQNYANLGDNNPNLGIGIRGYNTSFNVQRSTFAYSDPSGIHPVPFKPATGIEVVVEEENTVTVGISSNVFRDLTTSIQLSRIGSLEPATVDFTLKCNQFKLTCAETNVPPCSTETQRRGLVIGEGVRVRAPNGTTFVPDQIGGISAFNSIGVAYPNANEWPVRAGIDRTTLPFGTNNIQNLPWEMPSNWTSIDNNVNNPGITYHRYFNEFLINQLVEESETFNFISVPAVQSVRMTASTGGNPGELACEGFDIDDFDVFPLRVAVNSDSVHLLSATRTLELAGPWLGDAFPNPSSGEARIKAFVPIEEAFALLQIVDLGTGKVLSGKVLEERGQLELILDCTKAASGTYGYRLMLGNKQLGMKKFTILK
jgi:hypothetical protein